MNYSRAKKFK